MIVLVGQQQGCFQFAFPIVLLIRDGARCRQASKRIIGVITGDSGTIKLYTQFFQFFVQTPVYVSTLSCGILLRT